MKTQPKTTEKELEKWLKSLDINQRLRESETALINLSKISKHVEK